jgi:hypothetical protein
VDARGNVQALFGIAVTQGKLMRPRLLGVMLTRYAFADEPYPQKDLQV